MTSSGSGSPAGAPNSLQCNGGGGLFAGASTCTFSTSLTGPLDIGGTGAASTKTIQSTSGAGTTDAILFRTGSQVEALRITTGQQLVVGGAAVTPYATQRLTLLSDVSGGAMAWKNTAGTMIAFNTPNQARFDMYGNDVDATGAIFVLGYHPSVPANGQRIGHFAFAGLDSLGQQNTNSILDAVITDITHAAINSSIRLWYSDSVDGTPGYQQPNKILTLDKNGFKHTDGVVLVGDALGLQGSSVVTSNPPTVASNTGWKLNMYGTNYALGIGTFSMFAKLNGWFTGVSGNPANDAGATFPSSSYQFALGSTGVAFFRTAVQIGYTALPSGVPLMAAQPATQTIATGDTITDNGCGTIKRITAAGAVTTNTTDTFTAPAVANGGCLMTVCNTGVTNAITLDHNAHFFSVGGADVVLLANTCILVGSDATQWRQLTAILTGT